MDIKQINDLINNAMDNLYEKDAYLIINNLSERSISHKLGKYIEDLLEGSDLDVDCEYDKDIQNGNLRKSIFVLSEQLAEMKRKTSEEELTELKVIPDIIVHQRGIVERNYLIIEIKKEYPGRTINDDFDKLKLSHFTSPNIGNNLNYTYGVYLEIDTQTEKKSFRVNYYQNGEQIEFKG